jgi:hypothetical protein
MTIRALLLLAAFVATASAQCAARKDCKSCLDTPFCGWCSPAPTVYDNGTLGAQCQDQHESGWHCNHLYSTAKCEIGYVCTEGQCVQDPSGGTGDTKANCEKNCKPPPPPTLSKCNLKTSQCEPCADYCKADTDCPGSYCQAGLCHGSTCQQNTTCSATCSDDTPDILIGTWRGVQIQKAFPAGEYDMKFQKKAAGPQVMYRAPTGDTSTGSLSSDAKMGGKDLTITFDHGPLNGTTLKGAYSAWEPSPETEAFAFYFGAPNDDKPADINIAMNGTGHTVYVLSRCGHGAVACDFDGVFHSDVLMTALVQDPCNPNKDCSSCIGDKSGLCGWCSQNVVYGDGTKGAQCAGFDKTGSPLGWKCSGVFSKSDCADYGCDWTDPTKPMCVAGKGTLSKDSCASGCKAPTPQYTCDSSSKKCKPCDMHYCTSNKQCPGSYCNIQGAGPWSCHGAVPAGCMKKASCDAGCNSTETYAKCDAYAGQCKPVAAGTPGAVTKYECEHTCKGARPTGTYRAVAINKGFMRGEYDFTFYDDNTLHWRTPDGKTAVAALTSGSEVVEKDAVAVDGTITKSSDPSIMGKKIYAIFKQDSNGNDNIGKFLFHGFDFAPDVPSFDAAMTKTEWIMLGCKDGAATCDFSSRKVA